MEDFKIITKLTRYMIVSAIECLRTSEKRGLANPLLLEKAYLNHSSKISITITAISENNDDTTSGLDFTKQNLFIIMRINMSRAYQYSSHLEHATAENHILLQVSLSTSLTCEKRVKPTIKIRNDLTAMFAK